MRTIIAGSRDGTTMKDVSKAISKSHYEITSVVCGMARGADLFGQMWANLKCLPVEEFPANWELHGRSAGYIRNSEMASNADALIAVWDGKSKGTLNMIEVARKKGLEVFIYEVPH